MKEILDLYNTFDSTYIRVLTQGHPIKRFVPAVKRALRKIPRKYMILLPTFSIIMRRCMYAHKHDAETVGLCDSNISTIYVATAYRERGFKYEIQKEQVINTVLHELGHAVCDYFEDFITGTRPADGLAKFINMDIKKMSRHEFSRCRYFLEEEEMFAECFAYFTGSNSIIALKRKQFEKQFPNTLAEMSRRLDKMVEQMSAAIIADHMSLQENECQPT